MGIQIVEHAPGKAADAFIAVATEVFRDDPAWVAPLRMELRDRLNPKKNPFFKHADAAFFTAYRDGKLVGRASAQIDREHLRVHDDETGFFGFLDTVDDPEVSRALLEKAEGWLRERGMKRVRGPFSLSINEESGCLVDGFEHPPVVAMGHNRPYQGAHIEAAGYEKVQDLYAWKYGVQEFPERAKRAYRMIEELPEVRFRSVNKKNLRAELDILLEIFNDAWADNWGFVPMTEAELEKTAEDFSLLLVEDLAFFAEIDGRAVACCVLLPNVNEAARDLDGKLFPFGIAKLLWRLKAKGTKSGRLVLLGIRKELRGKKRYGALSTAMYVEVAKRGARNGMEWAELSWTLEDNKAINLGIRAMRGKLYKTYRVYEKAL